MNILLQEVVCIWFAQELAVSFIGVGFVKPNGQETVWEATGLVKTVVHIFLEN